MTRVYVDMVADLFHVGHVEMLRRARMLGDELVVGIHSDDTCADYKRRPVLTMAERVAVVAACRYVDEVVEDAPLVLDDAWIDEHHLDLVVHGDDFDEATARRFYGAAMDRGILRTLPYTPGISTTEIFRRLQERYREDADSAKV